MSHRLKSLTVDIDSIVEEDIWLVREVDQEIRIAPLPSSRLKPPEWA